MYKLNNLDFSNKIIIFLIVLSSFYFGFFNSCSATMSQLTDTYGADDNAYIVQYLGTNINGELGHIDIQLSQSGSGYPVQHPNIVINECDSNAYAGCANFGTKHIESNINGTQTIYQFDFTSDNLTFNPSKWYYFQLTVHNGSESLMPFHAYGNSSGGNSPNGFYTGSFSGNFDNTKNLYFIITGGTIYEQPTLEITFPQDTQTQYAAHWTFVYDQNDATTTDSGLIYVCYGVEASNATSCDLYSDHVTTAACDNATSTQSGTINTPIFQNLVDGETYHAKAYLYMSDKSGEFCAGNDSSALVAESAQIQWTHTTDLNDIADYDDSSAYWTGSWGVIWGNATSSIAYTAGATVFDTITEPLLTALANYSNYFDTNAATNAGVEAGSSIGIMISKAKDFMNVIPGLQLFYILLIAIIIDFGIFLIKFLFKFAQLIRG